MEYPLSGQYRVIAHGALCRTFSMDSQPAPWWHSNFHYRMRLTAHENSGHALTNYPLYAVVDTASLIAAGKMKSDCSDVRIIYNGVEIPSQVTGCDTATSKIWLQTNLACLCFQTGLLPVLRQPASCRPRLLCSIQPAMEQHRVYHEYGQDHQHL